MPGGVAGYLLDTNVISETSKIRGDPRVLEFLEQTRDVPTFLSVLTLGELRRGAYRLQLRKPLEARGVSAWVDAVESDFKERMLVVNTMVADVWGRFSADRDRSAIDTLLAATAYTHGLTLVTRNIRHFTELGVTLLNPWQD